MSPVRERPESKGADEEWGPFAGFRKGVPSVTASVELTRIELRRNIRWLRAQDFWLLYMLVSAAGLLFGSWVAFNTARDTGAALAAGESPTLSPAGIRLAWSVLWLFTVGFLIVDALGSNGDLDNDGHYLTIRPVMDIAGGKLLSSACKFSVFVFVPVLSGYLGLAIGTATPAPLVGGFAAAVAAIVTATAVGYPIGLALKGVIRRSETLTRLKPAIGFGVGLVYVIVLVTGEFMTVVDAIEGVLLVPPLSWLGDLALLTTAGAGANALGAVGAVVLTGFVACGTFLLIPAARYAWSADRTQPSDDEETGIDAPEHRIDVFLGVICQEPGTLGIASTTLLRAYRSPLQLIFVAFPLLAVIPLAERLLTTGTLPWYTPWFVVWYGTLVAGAAIPLNPLGNQGATLPTLLTAPTDGRQVVHGHVVAALPVAPLTAGIAAGAGHLAGRPGTEIVAITLVSVAAVVAGSALATGIGSVFPRFEAVDFAGSRQAVPPSKVAYGVFSTVLTLTVVASAVVVDDTALEIAAVVLSKRLLFSEMVSTDALAAVGWVTLMLVAVSVPLAYRIAVRRVDAYRLG